MTVWLDVRMNGCLLALLLPPRRQRCSAVLLLLFHASSSLGLTVERGSFIWLAWVRGEPRISLHRCQRCSSFRCCFAHCYLGRALSLSSSTQSPNVLYFVLLFWSGSSIVPCCKRRHFSNKTSRAHSIHLLNPNPTTNNMRTGLLEATNTDERAHGQTERREQSKTKDHVATQPSTICYRFSVKNQEREWENESNCSIAIIWRMQSNGINEREHTNSWISKRNKGHFFESLRHQVAIAQTTQKETT